MPTIGDLIGSYRLLAQISLTPINTLYVAEHTFANAGVALLILCTGVTVTTGEEQDKLLHAARFGSIQYPGGSLAIRDAGTAAGQHPYLVTAYSEEIQNVLRDYLQLLEQILQSTYSQHPNDPHVLFNAFLHTLAIPAESVESIAPTVVNAPTESADPTIIGGSAGGADPTTMSGSAGGADPTMIGVYATTSAPIIEHSTVSWKSRLQGRKPKKRLLTLLVAMLLVILVWGGFFLHINVSATSATVTITPVSKEFSQAYTLSVAATPGIDLYTVQGRQVSYTSQQKVQTVAATGQGTHAATSAKGHIVLSQINLTSTSPTGNYLAISSVTDPNGIKITTDEQVNISTGATVTIAAHADPGSAGNIGADDVDSQIQIVDSLTSLPIGTGFIANPDPFSGGNDATPYTFVKQSDISSVVNTFTSQLTPGAKAQTQKLVQPDEHMMQDIQCTTNSASNHSANSEANDATIKVSVTCSVLVYTDQALHDAAIKIYQSAGTTKFGINYGIVGDAIVSKPVESATGTFPITVDGIWSFQYTEPHLQAIRQSIAGKTTQDALQVLHKRPDMLNVSLATSGGIGSAVPTTLSAIQFVVTKVQGLHA